MNAQANFAAEENALAEQMLGIMVNDLMEKIDRPEMWKAFPQFLEQVPGLGDLICLSDQLPQPTPDEVAASMMPPEDPAEKIAKEKKVSVGPHRHYSQPRDRQTQAHTEPDR